MDDKVVLPPTVTSESKLTFLADHVRKYKWIYIGLVIAGGIFYKKFLFK